ncbi:MAG: hypothetical protein K8R31_04690 [Bacteroidales bacterium]|nr:hypothetical protein [Bacteroidales bacterium]
MKILKTIVAAILVLSVTAIQAQKIKVTNGDLSFLTGQATILLEYDYSEMAVGKFDKEEDYVNKKVAEYNEAEAGRGDTWKDNWEADREGRYHPKFEELLNNYTKKANCNFDQTNSDALYTLILKTTFTEPGFNIGIVKKDAMINVEVKFVETANTENILAVITITNIPGRGMGNDYDAGYRIQESYAKCGKSLGAFLVKKAFK